MANNTYGMFGSFAPDQDPKYVTTPLNSLRSIAHEVRYSAGCKDSDTKCMDLDYNLEAVIKDSEIVFLFLGTGQAMLPLLLLNHRIVSRRKCPVMKGYDLLQLPIC